MSQGLKSAININTNTPSSGSIADDIILSTAPSAVSNCALDVPRFPNGYSTSPTTPSTTPSTTNSPQFHKNNSDLVPATKYMAVVKERNQIQHQLSQSLSEIQNIHAKFTFEV